MKTCRYCGNKYDDEWRYWFNKYCCTNCYRNKISEYNIGDKLYSYKDVKEGKYLTAVFAECVIINIYELQHVTKNGLYQYNVKIDNRYYNRFEHQLFRDKDKCNKFIEVTNKRRELTRNVNKMLEDL